MASIVLTNNAQFKPYSFDEMLKPLAMATQEYNAIEQGIAELGSKADLMRMYANEQPDSKVANMYNTYANDLDKQAEDLAKYGLNPASRNSLLGLKRRYSTEITPIETAVTRRRQLAEEQRKALLQNPTLMFERNFNTLSNDTSLDRFIENPEYDYGARYSGAQITSDVSKMATNISKELRNYYVGNNVDDYTKTFIKQYGLSSSDIKKFIDNPNSKEANKVLFAIYNSALATVPESIRNNYAEEVRDYASKGLWDAVGTNQVSTFDDYGAKLNAQTSKANQQTLIENALAVNPLNIYAAKEFDTAGKNIKNFSKYFTKNENGQYIITEEGIKEFRELLSPKLSPTPGGSSSEIPSAFRQLMLSLGVAPEQGDIDNYNARAFGKIWEDYLNTNDHTKYDATKLTEWDYRLDPTKKAQDIYKGSITMANRGNESIQEVDYNNKTGKWEPTGEELTHADLLTDDYTILSRRPSTLGTTVMIQNNKTGEVKRYNMPVGVSTRNENASNVILSNLPQLYQALNDPELGENDRNELLKTYAQYINMLHMYESQKDIINQTNPQTYNPYSM